MATNRVFDPPADPLDSQPEPQPESPEAVQAKLARLLAQLPKAARQDFYVALNQSLGMIGRAVIELAPAGPRVIDPRRVVMVALPDAPDNPAFPQPPEGNE